MKNFVIYTLAGGLALMFSYSYIKPISNYIYSVIPWQDAADFAGDCLLAAVLYIVYRYIAPYLARIGGRL